MDTVILINGLGNQMSQYAFYLQKKKTSKSIALISFCNEHNGFELNKVFNLNIHPSFKEKIVFVIFRLLVAEKFQSTLRPIKKVLHWMNIKIIKEDYDYNFKKKFLEKGNGISYYFGGWHTEQYFSGVKDELSKKFKFVPPDDEFNLNYINQIKSVNSVSIHIRRGDYLNNANISMFGGVCTIEYYQAAIDLMESKFGGCHFFIFSNEMDWVKENLSMKNAIFVMGNSASNSWKDMYLMTLCKHNIIANSTFSWWGAWLNENENKVIICPNKFLKTDHITEVYPESWIRINA